MQLNFLLNKCFTLLFTFLLFNALFINMCSFSCIFIYRIFFHMQDNFHATLKLFLKKIYTLRKVHDISLFRSLKKYVKGIDNFEKHNFMFASKLHVYGHSWSWNNHVLYCPNFSKWTCFYSTHKRMSYESRFHIV